VDKRRGAGLIVNLKKFLKPGIIVRVLLVCIGVFLLWFYFSLPDVEYLNNENPKTTTLMEYRKEQAKNAGKKIRIRQQWVRFQQIPELLKKAVRITEDADFYNHEGIDWVELKESVIKNIEEGEYSRGGSTISQQLVKNLFLSTEKSIFRKIREFFITRSLENEISKNRIFHIYLNMIEFGPGVFGVQAASKYYFKKNVQNLSLNQIVRLTAVIPRPLSIKANGNNKWLKWKAGWILGKMKLYKYISAAQYNRSIKEFE